MSRSAILKRTFTRWRCTSCISIRCVFPRGRPALPADMVPDLDSFLAGDPAEAAELEDRFEKLGDALREQAPRAYLTLLMYRCEGATLEQIGERLGVSRIMARNTWSRR